MSVADPGTSADPVVRPKSRFSSTLVSEVISALSDGLSTRKQIERRWREAIAARVIDQRPDLRSEFSAFLNSDGTGENYLSNLSIGEVGVCYEALISLIDRDGRKSSGQFFTPDDAARFMASESLKFDDGVWLDPCCGVGNLAWHLADLQRDSDEFITNRLILVDIDPLALETAIALIAADHAAPSNASAIRNLRHRSASVDFLGTSFMADYDYVIANPPYARTRIDERFETRDSRDLFAYFMERIVRKSRGFITVTPASYLSSPKYRILRNILEQKHCGGTVYVFDNVPDTLFRGFKYGSVNTSKTNFVRAAVTVCGPNIGEWRITPILRWTRASRANMFALASSELSPRQFGPHDEWVKIGADQRDAWDRLMEDSVPLESLLSEKITPWSLDVALTPRYYISAAFKSLQRGSKTTLYFANAEGRDRAAVVLNSSAAYLWWRALDGGVTLPLRVLRSVPIPSRVSVDQAVVDEIRRSELDSIVVKRNAGRENQNVKHAWKLVAKLNAIVFSTPLSFDKLYANDMFSTTD